MCQFNCLINYYKTNCLLHSGSVILGFVPFLYVLIKEGTDPKLTTLFGHAILISENDIRVRKNLVNLYEIQTVNKHKQ